MNDDVNHELDRGVIVRDDRDGIDRGDTGQRQEIHALQFRVENENFVALNGASNYIEGIGTVY